MSRQILKPWLERILNESECPGVRWLDESRTTFQIPWPRAGNNGDDTGKQIFEKWAIHTGKYRQGIDTKDYSKWKSRLRCALNKAKVIECIGNMPDESNPIKIFAFSEYQRVPHQNEVGNCNFQLQFVVQEPSPAVLNNNNINNVIMSEMADLPDDLDSIKTCDLVPFDRNINPDEYILDKMDSLHFEDVQRKFDVYLEIDFEKTLQYEEFLPPDKHGFLVGSQDLRGNIHSELLVVSIAELNEEFPWLEFFCVGENIYANNFTGSDLCIEKPVGPRTILKSEKRVLLLHNQDNPQECVREVEMFKESGRFKVSLKTIHKDSPYLTENQKIDDEVSKRHSVATCKQDVQGILDLDLQELLDNNYSPSPLFPDLNLFGPNDLGMDFGSLNTP